MKLSPLSPSLRRVRVSPLSWIVVCLGLLGSPVLAQSGAPAGGAAPMAPAKAGVPNPHVTGEIPLPANSEAEGAGETAGASAPDGGAAAAPDVGPAKAGVVNPHASGQIPIGPSGDKAPPAPLTPGDGQLSGQLKHQGETRRPLDGYEVRLFAFEDQQRLGEWHVESGKDGSYSFQSLNTRPSIKYIVSALFQGVVYLGPTVSFTEGNKAQSGDIEVNDSTFAPGPLELSTMHVIVEGDPTSGALRLTEVLNFNNPGTRTLVGSETSTTTLQLDLPAGFTNLEVLQGMMPNQVASGEKTIFFTGPFYPGSNQVVFSYDYQPTGALVFRRRMPIKVGSVDVFVKPDGPAILSPQFRKEDPFKIQDTTFEHFTAGEIAAGSGVTFQIGGSENGNEADNEAIPGSAIGGVVVAIASLYILFPFFRRTPAPVAPTRVASASTLRIAELIRKRDFHLAAVNDADFDFESGKLSSSDHQSMRQTHKLAAIEVMQQLEVLQGPTSAPATVSASPALSATGTTGSSPALSDTAVPASVAPAAVAPVAAVSAPVPVPAPVNAPVIAAPPVVSETASPSPVARIQPLKFCTSCGTPPQPGDKFCGACGASLRPTV